MMCCCIAAVTFTSCLNDDDEPVLSPEEYQAAYQAIKGDYSGNLIYAKAKSEDAKENVNDKNANDTIKVHWRIDTDSTLYVADFPSAPLAEHITNKEIREAIAAQPVQKLECRMGIMNNAPITFLINPAFATYNVNYGGEDHKVQIAFYVNSTYSYGVYSYFNTNKEVDSKKPAMQMQILAGGVYVDEKLNQELLKKPVAIGFEGEK